MKHGISKLPDGGEIRIAAKNHGGQLQIEISDNGPGLSKKGTLPSIGLGLRNTRERLESLYGQDQRLDLLSLPGGGTTVHVRIPFLVRVSGNGKSAKSKAQRSAIAPPPLPSKFADLNY